MFDIGSYQAPSDTERSTALITGIGGSVRAEAQAVAGRLEALWDLFELRRAEIGERADWAVDTWVSVAIDVAAALRVSKGRVSGWLHDARAMRERLPKVGEVFKAGELSYADFKTIVFRTDLITDAQVLGWVDATVAANAGRWPSMSRGRLSGKIDAIVAKVDADAVRRRKEAQVDRSIYIGQEQDGLSRIEGALFTPDAHALDQRLSALAATVCARDPRNAEQRRADALGALAAGANRLGCRCGRTDCAAGTRRPASPVTIHVIADQAALTGRGGAGWEMGADGLITPELLAELAQTAKLVPLINPGWAEPEPDYTPSQKLADFVRCRDLTCRFPGCDVPASQCDIDHSIPRERGGPTHAGNLNCKCRTHHLIKTFWGWTETQLADGTLIFTSPAGATHVTTPGSALLFPSLCYSVGGMPAPEAEPAPPPTKAPESADRTAAMPRRHRSRAEDRAQRVAAERRANHAARAPNDDEPPPF